MSISRLAARSLALLAAAFVVLGLAVASAQPRPAPAGTPILEISGRISVTNGDARARFDLAMLEALGVSRTRTTTAWT
ncbi:MAG: oxidoreductase, partial [Alphaproteobacteria bacterium]